MPCMSLSNRCAAISVPHKVVAHHVTSTHRDCNNNASWFKGLLPVSLQEWIWWAVPKKKVCYCITVVVDDGCCTVFSDGTTTWCVLLQVSKHRRAMRNQNKWLKPVKQVSVCEYVNQK